MFEQLQKKTITPMHVRASRVRNWIFWNEKVVPFNRKPMNPQARPSGSEQKNPVANIDTAAVQRVQGIRVRDAFFDVFFI